MAKRRTAAEIAEYAEQQRIYARQEAIRVAHTDSLPAAEVVERAKAYFKFVVED